MKKWFCKRCESDVEDKKCDCTTSPSPWVPNTSKCSYLVIDCILIIGIITMFVWAFDAVRIINLKAMLP